MPDHHNYHVFRSSQRLLLRRRSLVSFCRYSGCRPNFVNAFQPFQCDFTLPSIKWLSFPSARLASLSGLVLSSHPVPAHLYFHGLCSSAGPYYGSQPRTNLASAKPPIISLYNQNQGSHLLADHLKQHSAILCLSTSPMTS